MSFAKKQKAVSQAIISAFALTIISYSYVYYRYKDLCDDFEYNNIYNNNKFKWILPLIIPLFGLILYMANIRWNHEHLIDGSAYQRLSSNNNNDNEKVDDITVLQAILQNTLEQTVLSVIVHLIFLLVFSSSNNNNCSFIAIQRVAACLFVNGRVLFIFGYKAGPCGRAFGFALSFHSTIVLMVVILLAS